MVQIDPPDRLSVPQRRGVREIVVRLRLTARAAHLRQTQRVVAGEVQAQHVLAARVELRGHSTEEHVLDQRHTGAVRRQQLRVDGQLVDAPGVAQLELDPIARRAGEAEAVIAAVHAALDGPERDDALPHRERHGFRGRVVGLVLGRPCERRRVQREQVLALVLGQRTHADEVRARAEQEARARIAEALRAEHELVDAVGEQELGRRIRRLRRGESEALHAQVELDETSSGRSNGAPPPMGQKRPPPTVESA